MKEKEIKEFRLNELGDIAKGRPHLGDRMPVLIYRMYQFSMRNVLERRFGKEETADILREAGYIAGIDLCNSVLDKTRDLDSFIALLQETFRNLNIGIVRIEEFEDDLSEGYIVVEEDIDCSGMPISGNVICHYDEGLLEGIFGEYANKNFIVREVDCWSTGSRVCRFRVKLIQ